MNAENMVVDIDGNLSQKPVPLFDLLSKEDRDCLTHVERTTLGPYTPWGDRSKACEFIFELDARPLVALIDSASYGGRIYELMSITRPGDILHYLWMKILEADSKVIERLKESLIYRRHGILSKVDHLLSELPFLAFDEAFNLHPRILDEEPFASLWYFTRLGQSFQSFFDIAIRAKEKLEQQDDFILKTELTRIKLKTHSLDLLPSVARVSSLEIEKSLIGQSDFPAEILELISRLIKQEDVNSIYCYKQDFNFWRMVVAEQLVRAARSNLAPQDALYLCGTDSGYVDEWAEAWGGEIFIPYEGAQILDLFIMPGWFTFVQPQVNADQFTFGYYQRRAHYVLVNKDYGELSGATRTRYGEWTLYKSIYPYRPVYEKG